MAATPPTKAPAKTKGKGGKFHGAPTWVVAVGIGAGGFLLYKWYSGRNAAAATTTTAATAPATTPYGGYGGGGGPVGGGGVGGGTGAGADTNNPGPPIGGGGQPIDTGVNPGGPVQGLTPSVPIVIPSSSPTSTATAAPTIAQLRTNITTAANAYYANPNPTTLANLQATRGASEQGGVTAAEVQKLESQSQLQSTTKTASPGGSAIGILTPKAKAKKK